MLALSVLATTPAGAVSLVRINCGGPAYTDQQGQVWSADQLFNGGLTYNAGAVAIAGTLDDTLYQSERNADFTYRIPLTNGSYEVVLRFAEVFWTSAGARRFDVFAEGASIVTNLDVWAAAGANTALDLHSNVTVADGFLDLQFVTIVNRAKVSAIEVLTTTTNPPPPATPQLTVIPGALNFGTVLVGTTGTVQTVALGNSGTASLTVTNVALAGASAGSYRLTQAAPYVLSPGQTATVSVAFAPATAATLPATLVVGSTATNPVSVALSGTGTNAPPPATPQLTVIPGALNFGTVLVGTTGTVQTVALGNSGTASLTVTNVVLAGASAGSYRLTQAAPYVLSPGQTATVSVAFAPASAVSLPATLVVAATATNPVSVALSGTGTNAPAPPPVTTNQVSLVRIRCGGAAYTDAQGRVWAADSLFNGGLTYSAPGTAIAGTVEDPLYQAERFADFAYAIPVTNGTYEVVLKFAEIFWTSAGARRFNVLGEGSVIVTNLDIWATAGANTALDLRRTVTVADGTLNLQFVSLANNAKVSAIEVLTVGSTNAPPPPPPPPATPQLTVIPGALNFGTVLVGTTGTVQTVALGNSGTASLTVTNVALAGASAGSYRLTQAAPYVLGPGQTATVSVAFAPASAVSLPATLVVAATATNPVSVALSGTGQAGGPPPPLAPVGISLYRINAGGGLFTDGDGNLWLTDAGFYNEGNSFIGSDPIAGTTLDPLYQSERWDGGEAPEMAYSFPVEPGVYRVRLHFAEIFSGTAYVGGRVFGVDLEGAPALNNFDIFAEAGFATALMKEFDVACSDGAIDIAFRHGVQNPKISAIEILTTRATLSVTPNLVDWGHVSPGTTGPVTQVTLQNTSAQEVQIDTLTFRINAGLGRAFVARINGTDYNGGESGATHAMNLTIPPGGTQPVLLTFRPESEGEADAWLDLAGNFDTTSTRLHGEGGEDDGHPFLHVVIKVPDYTVDFDNNGTEPIHLDGTDSHTHELGHVLQRYEWRENGALIGTNAVLDMHFATGTHTVTLQIFDDNVPPETLTHSATFRVVPADAVPGGLALYYDAGATNPAALLDAVPVHADFGERLAGLRLDPVAGRLGGSPFTGAVMVVLSGQLDLAAAGTYTFQFAGGNATRQLVNGTPYTGPRSLAAGRHRVEGRFAVPAPGAGALQILMGLNGATPQAIDAAIVTHDESTLAPVINTMPRVGLPVGGNPITIEGLGFVPPGATTVHWGTQTFSVPALQVTPTAIRFTAPPGTGSVPVRVTTPAGASRTVSYLYSDQGPAPVVFAQNGPIPVAAPTQAAWGPDGRLYVASLFGPITVLTFDDGYNVVSQQVINAIAALPNSNILGLTFNPHDGPGVVRLYVAHSQLYAHGGVCFDEYSPYNGQVSVLTGPAFDTVEALITGLPVSNHDHGINGLEFDNNGDLLIAVGGQSNAGVPGCNMGGLPESPLSAAVLKAYTSRTNFNGVITYRETATGLINMDQRAGDVVDVAPGVDVGVFAAGFRNMFDLTLTTAGRVYGTDNGPNDGFGAASTSSTGEAPDPTDSDTLNLIEDGHYYGHPNRNRGRRDSRQDVYTGTAAPSVAQVFSQGLAVFPASVNGIVEYRAEAFNGAMRGELLMQKWGGETFRAVLTPDGRATVATGVLPVNLPALDLVTGPGGVLIGTDYDNNALAVAVPVDAAAIGMKVYDIHPWRAPAAGGRTFVIGGTEFGSLANTTVTIGGTPAVLTAVSATRIHGIIPARANPRQELLDVQVRVGAALSTLTNAFRYLTPPGTANSACAALEVETGNNLILGTTWLPSAFLIRNLSAHGQKLERIEIDVSTTVLMDQVWDPAGTAGDDAGKLFTVDMNAGAGPYALSLLAPKDGGFDRLALTFNDFAPGGLFGFSVDVDGTSIKGSVSPGPGDSGSNAGLELAGGGVTFWFSDGTVQHGHLFSVATNVLAVVARGQHGAPEAPVVSVTGIGVGPATVTNASQTVRVTARAGTTVDVVVTEGFLYTNGVPGGGFDLDPYEDNSLEQVQRHVVAIGPAGTADVPVTLFRTGAAGGYNHIMAVVRDSAGAASPMPTPIVLYYAQGGGGFAPDMLRVDRSASVLPAGPMLSVGSTTQNTIVLSWPGASGQLYTIYESTNLLGGWRAVGTFRGDGRALEYVVPEDLPAAFYKLGPLDE